MRDSPFWRERYDRLEAGVIARCIVLESGLLWWMNQYLWRTGLTLVAAKWNDPEGEAFGAVWESSLSKVTEGSVLDDATVALLEAMRTEVGTHLSRGFVPGLDLRLTDPPERIVSGLTIEEEEARATFAHQWLYARERIIRGGDLT